MKNRKLLLLWMILLLFTSCITTDNFRIIKAELFAPGLLAIDSIDTVAIFDSSYDYNTLRLDTFYYELVDKEKMVKDTLVKYKDLSNTCTDAMADYLLNSGYFKAVINFRDSLCHPLYSQAIVQRLQNRMNYDACIFLDFFGLQDELMTNSCYFDAVVIDNFPEFENSSMMETVGTRLLWSIVLKNDSSKYSYRRFDNLFYGNSINQDLFGNDASHRKLLKNTAGTLGESFANELVPHWQMANRIYYRSNNPQMLTAQKKLLSGDYTGAAEIYRLLTKNKNQNIAAKAAFNMALICEIEGSLDASLDWLSRLANVTNKYDFSHFSRCEKYIALIKKRQKEVEVMNQSIKNNGEKAN